MRDEVIQKLLDINHAFYAQFATSFHRTRMDPAYGFYDVIEWLPDKEYTVLDVGCGNGRFGYFLHEHGRLASYLGVDYSEAYMGKGKAWAGGQGGRLVLSEAEGGAGGLFAFRVGNMMEAGFLDGVGVFDLVVCFSAMHHVPTQARRLALTREMAAHKSDDGYLLLGNWQFTSSPRQQRKILDWETVGLTAADVEPGDYLISWRRGGFGYRYVHLIDAAETEALAAAAQLEIVHQFRADGREGNLNLYTLMA